MRRAGARSGSTASRTCSPSSPLWWIGNHTSAERAIAVAALVAGPHVLLDDGRVVGGWMRKVKHASDPAQWLTVAVDQSFHVVCLLGAALVAAS
jgi:hypothetical protein